jgi:hypothetical protein
VSGTWQNSSYLENQCTVLHAALEDSTEEGTQIFMSREGLKPAIRVSRQTVRSPDSVVSDVIGCMRHYKINVYFTG